MIINYYKPKEMNVIQAWLSIHAQICHSSDDVVWYPKRLPGLDIDTERLELCSICPIVQKYVRWEKMNEMPLVTVEEL